MFQVQPLSSLLFYFSKNQIKNTLCNKLLKIGSFIHQQHNICKTIISWKAPTVPHSFLFQDPAPFS